MMDAYRNNRDLYATIASKVYKKPYEDCKEFYPDGTTNPEGKKRRTSCKSVLLGLLYGRGANSIGEQLGITKEEAIKLTTDFFNEFSSVRDFINQSQEFARDYGFVSTAWGRKRRLPNMQLNPIDVIDENPNLHDEFDPFNFSEENSNTGEVSDEIYYKYLRLMLRARSFKSKQLVKQLAADHGYKIIDNSMQIENAKRQCVNSIIQGSSADMTKLTMIAIDNDPTLQRLQYKLIIPVHDEVLGVCPKENAKEVKERLEYIMVHIVDDYFDIPMKCDIEVTERWYGDEVKL